MQRKVTLGKSDPPWVTPAGCDRERKAIRSQAPAWELARAFGSRLCSAESHSARVTHRGSHLPGVTVNGKQFVPKLQLGNELEHLEAVYAAQSHSRQE